MTDSDHSDFFLPGDAKDSRYKDFRDHQETRAWVEALWSRFWPYAESNFRTKAKNHFHPQFWEMYLGVALLERGFQLQRVPKKSGGPDFYFIHGNRKIWVEAVAPEAGTGTDHVPEIPCGTVQVVREPDIEKILLRFTNVFDTKRNQYVNAVSNSVIENDDLYILAINSHMIPNAAFVGPLPLFVRALLPFGAPTLVIDKQTGEITDGFYQCRESIAKAGGETVPTMAFLDPQFAFVSAVLHSAVPWVNCPTVLDADFVVLHNPLASNPLDPGVFPWYKQMYYRNGMLETVPPTA